jgi:hypothetical protein
MLDVDIHLSAAHGFTDWSDTDYRDHYPQCIGRDGAVDLDGLHARDHRVNQWDLDHEHEGEELAGTPERPDYPEPIASDGYDRSDG